jgi:hypothetical protein
MEDESPIPFTSPPQKTEVPSPTATPGPETGLQVPTPSPGLGVVTGNIVAVSPAARAFLAGDIYLAPIIHTEGETPMPFIRLKPDKDPKATLRNEENEFAVVDVPPGEYGLIIHTPVNDYVVPEGEGKALIIEVKADETLDLGVIELQ